MRKSKFENFLAFRERLLSREKNQVQVPSEALLSIALVYPNTYAVGMANLGFQTIYRLFNEFPGVRCERVFLYEKFPDVTRSLETGSQLRNFDIIAFSISFELDVPNIVQILMNANISPFSSDRHPLDPLIMVGGAMAFLNPTPIAPFIDFFYLGEIEPELQNLLLLLLRLKKAGWERNSILEELHEKNMIYVPEKHGENRKLTKAFQSAREQSPQYSPIISPDSHFQNMFLVEVGRGCGRHCYFCAASHIYYPFRIVSKEKILNTIFSTCKYTKKVGLVGAALSDYPQLFQLCSELVEQQFKLGLSSFRLDVITSEFVKVLVKGNIKTLTFAPEAGTERLRNLIHKNLSNEQILEAAQAIADSQINQVKLYFIIGLPGETDDDIMGIVYLIEKIQNIFRKNKGLNSITVSVNAFIPKPFTPFQWFPIARESEIRRKRKYLEREFKKLPGVQFNRKSVKDEILQVILSLGDQKIAEAIYYKIKNKVDWGTAWNQAGIDVERIICQPRKFEDQLPWDFIEYDIPKERLWKKWKSLL